MGFTDEVAAALRDVLPQLMFVTDTRGGTTYVNRPWADYTGLSFEQAQATGWLATAHPVDRDEVAAAFATSVTEHAPFEVRLRLRRASDGAYRTFLCRSRPVRDQAGTVTSFVGTCTDVDEAQRSFERQRVLAEAGRALAEANAPDRLPALTGAAVPTLGDWCAVLLFDQNDAAIVRAAAHVDPASASVLQELIGRPAPVDLSVHGPYAALRAGQTVRVPALDAAQLERAVRGPGARALLQRIGVASTLVVALVARGETLGAIAFGYGGAARHTREDAQTAEELARRLALWIDNERIHEEAERRAGRLSFVADVSRVLGESLDLGATMASLLGVIVPAQADWAVLHTFETDGQLVSQYAAHVDSGDRATLAAVIHERYGAEWDAGANAAIASGRPYVEVYADPGGGAVAPPIGSPLAYRALASFPLHAHGTTYGALTIARIAPDRTELGPDLALFQDIAHRSALAIANAGEYEREHRVATVLQTALLPTSLPSNADFAFDAVYQPGRSEAQIGGDWYDALRLYDGRIVVSIGDVSGSGLAAAVTMGSMRQVIRGIAQVQADPALMLDAADKVLRAEGPERFVTAFVGVLDPVTLDFTYACAGHPPPIVRHADGSLEFLGTSSLPLGLRRPMEGGTATIALDEGALVVLYTDGLTEATRDPIEGERRLREALADGALAGSSRVARRIYDRVLSGSSPDDVAILTIGVRTLAQPAMVPPEADGRDRFTVAFDIVDAQGARDARRAFIERLAGAGVSGEALDAAELIVGELLGNVYNHAPGRAELMFDRQHEAIVLHVIDRGRGFEVAPALPRDMFSENGRGLFLISRLSSDFQITKRTRDGSHARVVLATDDGPAGRPTHAGETDFPAQVR